MTQTLTMRSSWTDRLRDDPATIAALAVFVLSIATLAGAWFFQFVLKRPPCPLCLEQRLPYHVVIPLALLLTIAALARAPQRFIAVGFVLVIVTVLCGAALAGYHAGVEWHFWPGPAECTGQLTDIGAGGPLLDQLHRFNVVRCDEAAWRFFGLSLAGYNFLISLLIAGIATYGLLHRKQRP